MALGACALVQRQSEKEGESEFASHLKVFPPSSRSFLSTIWKKINYEYALPKTKESNHEKDEVKDRRNEELRRGLFL